MKKAAYIILSGFLGIILSFIVHASIEIPYLKWAQKNNIAIRWFAGCALPIWLNILLFVLGAVFGVWLGFFWWKKVYGERTIAKPSLLKFLIFLLAFVSIVGIIWTLNYYLVLKGEKTTKPLTVPSASLTLKSTPTVSPSSITPSPTTNETSPTVTLNPDFTPTPAPTSVLESSIKIEGDSSCISDTLAALNLLASSAPDHYSAAQEYIGIVECVPQGSGIWVWENPPRYTVGDSTRQDSGTMWYASTFPHEACHTKQYRDGRSYFGELAETECLNAQYSALEQMGASQSTLDYVQGLASTKYWEVPYENRWW